MKIGDTIYIIETGDCVIYKVDPQDQCICWDYHIYEGKITNITIDGSMLMIQNARYWSESQMQANRINPKFNLELEKDPNRFFFTNVHKARACVDELIDYNKQKLANFNKKKNTQCVYPYTPDYSVQTFK